MRHWEWSFRVAHRSRHALHYRPQKLELPPVLPLARNITMRATDEVYDLITYSSWYAGEIYLIKHRDGEVVIDRHVEIRYGLCLHPCDASTISRAPSHAAMERDTL